MNDVYSSRPDRLGFARCALAMFCATLALAPRTAAAQAWPNKPLRLIVPFGAGSTADIIARLVGTTLSKDLGQQVNVENRPGAAGTIGGAEAARAAPDGHTLVLGTVASHGTGTLMMANVSYDPVKDFQAITLITNAPGLIAVHSSLPARSLKDLVAIARRDPNLNYTSSGPGTTTHLAGEFMWSRSDVKVTHVPYKAAGQAITDFVGGHVPIMIYAIPALRPFIDSGKIRPIAVTSVKRVPSLPTVPTVGETLIPGFDFTAWFGIMAPAGTPRPIIDRVHKSILAAMETPELKQQFAAQGLEPVGMGPDEFQAFMKLDLVRWREVIAKAGIKAE
ncbi:MAG: tripartite tricarboxylate transporter substrate binding protein [Proteobacteria bacterium]|nr:tripartite tricarboxylate transporter substrate binding protein [Burkholderiales bacterium]